MSLNDKNYKTKAKQNYCQSYLITDISLIERPCLSNSGRGVEAVVQQLEIIAAPENPSLAPSIDA